MQKILVPIDGSESCNKAALQAKKNALLCQASVTFITIVEPKFSLVTNKEELEEKEEKIERQKKYSKEFLNECSNIYKTCKIDIEASGLKTKMVVKEGKHPAQTICRYAEENNFDLIVISDKGRSNIKDYLLGGTVEKVVRHSKISVLLVK